MVGIVVDGATHYGRAVMLGVTRYASLSRPWLIYEEMRPSAERRPQLPECDGIIAAGITLTDLVYLQKRCRHVVHCSGSPHPGDASVVCTDDVAVGRMAAEHLLDCQLTHFAFYGWPNAGTSANRQRGFIQSIEQRGFTCDAFLATSTFEEPNEGEQRITHLRAWLRDLPKPIGSMAVDDTAAHALAAACLESEIAVPDHVAIVGVNNDELLCESAWPPLSSVETDYTRVGYRAAQILDRLLTRQKLHAGERLVRLPPLNVVRRLSTDVLAVDDPHLADAVRFIRDHACEPCTMPDVLREVPVNRRWLERQFARKLGRTPHDEIMRVRMETARRLLMEPTFTIPDVAGRCGFSAASNFSRAFSAAYGTTPGVYRRTILRPAAFDNAARPANNAPHEQPTGQPEV